MRYRRVVAFALVLAVIVPAGRIVARQSTSSGTQTPPQQPTFRSRVDSVSVDVSVTDRQGRPVTDLKPEDFEIREAGKLQTVDTFKFIEIDDGRDDPAAARDVLSLSDMQRETSREDNRLLVIFLDDYHVRQGNGMRIRQRLASWASTLTPHDLVAVAYPFSPVSGLTFTRDHDAVASMMMSFEGRKYDYTPKNALEERYQSQPPELQEQMRNDLVVSALETICEFMGTLREGRKTVLYVSEGMSGSLPPGVRTRGSQVTLPGGIAPTTPRSDSQQFFDSSSLLNNLRRVFVAAARTNTAIYTMDPRGLTTGEFGIDDNVNSAADRQILQESTDLLRVIAGETEGRAIVSRNDPVPELQKMVRDSSAYYLLGYVSTLAPRDGKFHEIQVKVKRPGVDIRARKGYWALSMEDLARATAPPKPAAPTDVLEELDHLTSVAEPSRKRPITMWLGAARGATERAQVTFVWEAPTTPPSDPLDVVDRVTITATSIQGERLFSGPVPRDETASRPAGKVTFDAPAGAVTVRATSENVKGLRIDTEDAQLDIPDFTVTGPQITMPFVYRGRTARDITQIRQAAAPLPVATRVFSRTERLLLKFDAYGPAGTTPNVTMKLLNTGGTSIAALPAPAHTGPAFESELSLGAFPPGDYLIEISAESNGDIIRRLLGIRVTG